MENFKIESRYLKICNKFRAVITYKGCFLQTRLWRAINVSVNQKIRPSICFKTWLRAFERLSRAFKTLGKAFKTLNQACEGLRENQKLGQKLEKLGRVFVL